MQVNLIRFAEKFMPESGDLVYYWIEYDDGESDPDFPRPKDNNYETMVYAKEGFMVSGPYIDGGGDYRTSLAPELSMGLVKIRAWVKENGSWGVEELPLSSPIPQAN